jgi:heme/copper-type cytochrome/quinol oxidase subunit 4
MKNFTKAIKTIAEYLLVFIICQAAIFAIYQLTMYLYPTPADENFTSLLAIAFAFGIPVLVTYAWFSYEINHR